MTQAERDRLVALKKAKKKLITQKQAAEHNAVDVSADLVRLFLADLEQSRQCTIATRNQRLTTIHALARFVAEHSPEHIAWCGQPFPSQNVIWVERL
jgi:hypothetical protein